MAVLSKAATQMFTLHASAAETATGQSAGFNVSRFREALVELNVTAVAGTPTLDMKIQTSDDGTDWYDMGASFTQITGILKPAVLKLTNFGSFVRGFWTIGGSTPSFTFTMKLVAKA